MAKTRADVLLWGLRCAEVRKRMGKTRVDVLLWGLRWVMHRPCKVKELSCT